MTVLIIIYVIFMLAVAAYAGVNIYHVIRFRIKEEDDKSPLALLIYISLIVVIFLISIIGAIIAYNL